MLFSGVSLSSASVILKIGPSYYLDRKAFYILGGIE